VQQKAIGSGRFGIGCHTFDRGLGVAGRWRKFSRAGKPPPWSGHAKAISRRYFLHPREENTEGLHVKALITVDLKAASAEAAQQALCDLWDGMKLKGLIGSYAFEIETPEGTVTDRCVLAEGKVVA
jgi:hypothetical protein